MNAAQISKDGKIGMDRLKPGRYGILNWISRTIFRTATALPVALIGLVLVSNSASADVAGEDEIQVTAQV